MGAVISSLSLAFQTLHSIHASYTTILNRINTSPGKPPGKPTTSAWQLPLSELSAHTSESAPEEVDVLIIGSGITACSIAYNLLKNQPAEKPLTVAIFEARDLCGGGTGRNGGNIKETPYLEWGNLVKRLGRKAAEEVIRFRMDHLRIILDIAEKEGLSDKAEVREVETVDVFAEEEAWKTGLEKFRSWIEAFPLEEAKWKVWEGEEAREKFSIPHAFGAITGPAGALAPYTLISELYCKLLRQFTGFTIDCNTPVETIQGNQLDAFGRPASLDSYSCFVSRGSSRMVRAKHVVHANNGYVSRLLPGLRSKIIPVRGQMTSQRLYPEGAQLPYGAARSWSFIWTKGFDYLTIRPDGRCMLGGGLSRSPDDGGEPIGSTQDDRNSIFESAYLGGLLPAIFPGLISGVKIEDCWTGIMGFSMDSLPWVGEVPEKVADGRRRGIGKEWICAGYSGEGMVNAWGCGRGLATMIQNEMLGEEKVVGLPECMIISEKRAKTASVEMLIEDWL